MEGDSVDRFDFQALPIDIKIKIFSYFSPQFLSVTVANVCKTWWELSKDPSLWKDLDLSCNYKANCADQFRAVLIRCTMLRKLTIRGRLLDGIRALYMIGETFSSPTLRVLTIDFAILCQELLTNLVEKFPSLESVDFHECYTYENEYDFVQMICKLSKLKSLKVNVLGLDDYFDDCSLTKIAEEFSKLETLHLHCNSTLSHKCVRNLVLLRQKTLKDVKLLGCRLTDEGVSCFSLCSGLTSLGLACTSDITDVVFDALEQLDLNALELNCWRKSNNQVSVEALSRFFGNACRRNLTKLSLGGFENVSDEVLRNIAQTCINLSEFSIRDTQLVTDEGLSLCLKSLTLISYLSLKQCPFVTKAVIATLPQTVQVVM